MDLGSETGDLAILNQLRREEAESGNQNLTDEEELALESSGVAKSKNPLEVIDILLINLTLIIIIEHLKNIKLSLASMLSAQPHLVSGRVVEDARKKVAANGEELFRY